MADFAVVALEGSLHASVGAFLDAFALVRRRVESLFPSLGPVPMETALRLLTPGATALRLADGRQLTSAGSPGGGTQFDVIHLPAFEVRDLAGLDERLAAMTPFNGWLRRQHAAGALLAASGSGCLILAAAGLLETTAAPLPAHLAKLAHVRFPRLQIDDRGSVVEAQHLLLSRGPAADAELMARIYEFALSPEMGRWLAAASGVDQRMEQGLARDPLVAQAQLWLERRFAEDVRIGELADALSTSHQTLVRRFVRELGVRPKDYVQQLRVRSAQQMLSRTGRSIEQIAAMVGYRDTRSFRIIFREHLGMSPTAYRRSGGAAASAAPPLALRTRP